MKRVIFIVLLNIFFKITTISQSLNEQEIGLANLTIELRYNLLDLGLNLEEILDFERSLRTSKFIPDVIIESDGIYIEISDDVKAISRRIIWLRG